MCVVKNQHSHASLKEIKINVKSFTPTLETKHLLIAIFFSQFEE